MDRAYKRRAFQFPDGTPRSLAISGRFRAGTSLLWQCFAAVPKLRCWYEPLHDHLPEQIAHVQPMASHRGIEDYWGSYRAQPAVLERYQRQFALSRLWLDADARWPQLEAYLRRLLDAPPGQYSVLKFNRVSLRLPWLRQAFPELPILHVRRDARACWRSSRRHLEPARRELAGDPDAYDLAQWLLSLGAEIPWFLSLLERPSYSGHYALWQLDARCADVCADLTLDYDHELAADASGLDRLVEAHALPAELLPELRVRIQPMPEAEADPYAPDWYADQEQRVDAELAELGLDQIGRQSLAEIRDAHTTAWQRIPTDPGRAVGEALALQSHWRGVATVNSAR